MLKKNKNKVEEIEEKKFIRIVQHFIWGNILYREVILDMNHLQNESSMFLAMKITKQYFEFNKLLVE